MSLIDNESVHLIVTSPPYWQLKDYGTSNQIGFHEDYESYINSLNLVWDECYRILHQGCRLCVNIGDQFARSVYYGRYKVIPIRTEIIKCCESLGFDYMGAVIWQKQTTMNTSGGGSVMGSFPYPRNGILKIDYEFILLFKKLGNAPKPTLDQKQRSRLSKEEWNTYFSGHWNFGGVRQDSHMAMFPQELPSRLIKMFSFYGETVCDPFSGSGTTNLAAMHLNRNSIGYEINPEYIEVIKKRLSPSQREFFDNKIEYQTDSAIFDAASLIASLPYKFSDPHNLDKKIDPRNLLFGSRIDKNQEMADEYYNVKDIVSPSSVLLSNGLLVRLLGIKEKASSLDRAVQYLKTKLQGQQVYLKFDSTIYDANNTLLCYMYMKNKTFINMHLIKEGLVDVDESVNFQHLNRFKEVNNERLS